MGQLVRCFVRMKPDSQMGNTLCSPTVRTPHRRSIFHYASGSFIYLNMIQMALLLTLYPRPEGRHGVFTLKVMTRAV